MHLTLQTRTGMWLGMEKKIAGIENVFEEEEYNQFDEIPSLDTSYKPQLLGTNKTPYLWSDHSETIHIQKPRKKKQAQFLLNPFVMLEDVSIGGNLIRFVI
jgi:hypothetical protein